MPDQRPTSEEIRPLVLDFLRQQPVGHVTQLVNLVQGVERELRQRGFYALPSSTSPGVQHSAPPMPDEDKDLIRQVVWNLIIEGVIIPGASEYQSEVHFLKLSAYGRSVVNAQTHTNQLELPLIHQWEDLCTWILARLVTLRVNVLGTLMLQ